MPGKLRGYLSRNIVAVVTVPALVLIHWGWYRLQNVEEFVKKDEKKDIPIVIGARYLVQVLEEKLRNFRGGNNSAREE